MASLVTTLQTIAADGVGAVTVTPIVADGDHFVREIRVVTDDETQLPLFVLRIRAATSAALDIITPPLSF